MILNQYQHQLMVYNELFLLINPFILMEITTNLL